MGFPCSQGFAGINDTDTEIALNLLTRRPVEVFGCLCQKFPDLAPDLSTFSRGAPPVNNAQWFAAALDVAVISFDENPDRLIDRETMQIQFTHQCIIKRYRRYARSCRQPL